MTDTLNQAAAPIVGIFRHRIETDGEGVTTLVGFFGCPLRCRYCLNPHSFDAKTKCMHLLPEELYERVKIDQLYFLASGGGVTFGGGEPLEYAKFISEFRALCGPLWHICAETSLAVPWEKVRLAADCVDKFIIDCKDTDPEIYKSYTGKDNAPMLDNLQKLAKLISPERITVRIPLIKDFNTEENRQKSAEYIRSLGISSLDLFEYTIR